MEGEEKVGIMRYMSSSEGISGKIKVEPEDFIVEEIAPGGIVVEVGKSKDYPEKEGGYLHFTLEKYNWDTMRAVKQVARACKVSHKRLKYAGTKDRRAITAQRVSIWKVEKEKLEKLDIKDITVRDFTVFDEPVNLGTLDGNRFTVNVLEVSEDAKEKAEKIFEELSGRFPNYFGTQRFGMRLNNHIVGKKILLGDFEGAVLTFLCDSGNETSKEARAARENLQRTGDYKKAFEEFPNYLGFEKSVINHLSKVPTDYVGALRVLPKKLRKMMVHAYQGYLFNLALSQYIKAGDVPEEMELVGYTTKPDETTARILGDEGIGISDFRVNGMPEMSLEGIKRGCLVSFKDFSIVDFNPGEHKISLRFTLPPGAYATMLLREIIK